MPNDSKNIGTQGKRKIELDAISEWVADGQSVLDLGCGRGILLSELMRKHKDIYAVGVDTDFVKITHCLRRGVNTYHGDIMDALNSFDDNSFDWIVCSRTLAELENAKEVIMKSLAVANRVAVGFINYGFWLNRLSVLFTGNRVVNKVFPEKWEESRPTSQISINDFKEFCRKNDIKINRAHYLTGDWRSVCTFLPNLFAGYAIFDISLNKK